MSNKKAIEVTIEDIIPEIYIAKVSRAGNVLNAFVNNRKSLEIPLFQSDCKYKTNYGFVCPLKAYRAENLFFING